MSTALEESRLSIKKEEQEAFLEQVGRDGSQLLSMLYQEETPSLLAHLPQVQILRQIWVQHFFWEEGQLRLRNKGVFPLLISRYAHLMIHKLILGEKEASRGMDTKSISAKPVIPTILI
jgi:hypothetical protein